MSRDVGLPEPARAWLTAFVANVVAGDFAAAMRSCDSTSGLDPVYLAAALADYPDTPVPLTEEEFEDARVYGDAGDDIQVEVAFRMREEGLSGLVLEVMFEGVTRDSPGKVTFQDCHVM